VNQLCSLGQEKRNTTLQRIEICVSMAKTPFSILPIQVPSLFLFLLNLLKQKSYMMAKSAAQHGPRFQSGIAVVG